MSELSRISDHIDNHQWLTSREPEKIIDFVNQSDNMVCILESNLITPWCYNRRMYHFFDVFSEQMEDFDVAETLAESHSSVLNNVIKMRDFFSIKSNEDQIYSFTVTVQEQADGAITVEGVAMRLPLQKGLVLVVMAEVDSATATLPSLTDQEKNILYLLKHGRSRKQVACQLNISLHTVHTHVKNIYQKLGVSKLAQITL